MPSSATSGSTTTSRRATDRHGRVAFFPLVRIRIKCRKPKDYPDEPQTIGQHLKKRRLEPGLTQKQAAKALGVNPWTVLNWETGRFEPPIRWVQAILRFLDYDPFPPPTTVGERLLRVRRQHGWSTSEAARQLGVDRTTWQDWERGELILVLKHRTELATLLGLDQQELSLSLERKASAVGMSRTLGSELCHLTPTLGVHDQFGGSAANLLGITILARGPDRERSAIEAQRAKKMWPIASVAIPMA